MKYIRKQKVVEVMFFNGTEESALEIYNWSDKQVKMNVALGNSQDLMVSLVMKTKYGIASAVKGDYIIRGSCGLYYPCSEEGFKENYTGAPEPETTFSYPEVRRLIDIFHTQKIYNPVLKDDDAELLERFGYKVHCVENGHGGYCVLGRA